MIKELPNPCSAIPVMFPSCPHLARAYWVRNSHKSPIVTRSDNWIRLHRHNTKRITPLAEVSRRARQPIRASRFLDSHPEPACPAALNLRFYKVLCGPFLSTQAAEMPASCTTQNKNRWMLSADNQRRITRRHSDQSDLINARVMQHIMFSGCTQISNRRNKG